MVQVQGYRTIDAIEPENGPFHIKAVYDVSHASVPFVDSLPASIRYSCSAALGNHAIAQNYTTALGALSHSILRLFGCIFNDRAPISAYQRHWSDRKLLILEQKNGPRS